MGGNKEIDFVYRVRSYLRGDIRLGRLSVDARCELEAEVLAKVFLRKVSKRQKFNRQYVRVLGSYQLRTKPRDDPYVRRARHRTDERRRWGLPAGAGSLSMSRQPSAVEPIDVLIEQEEAVARSRLICQIKIEIFKLNSRVQLVMAKYLRGEPLSQPERCIWYRAIQALRHRLRPHSN